MKSIQLYLYSLLYVTNEVMSASVSSISIIQGSELPSSVESTYVVPDKSIHSFIQGMG